MDHVYFGIATGYRRKIRFLLFSVFQKVCLLEMFIYIDREIFKFSRPHISVRACSLSHTCIIYTVYT